MRKKWIVASLMAAIVGLCVSFISIYEYVHIMKKGLEEASFCSLNEVVNCDVVNASSYSELFGIPVAAWGFLFYLFVVFYTLYLKFSKEPQERSLSVIWVMNIVGFIWTIRMAYISAFVLKAVCLTCLAQYTINLFLLIALTVASTVPFKERIGCLYSKKIFSHSLTLAMVFGLGYLFALASIGSAEGKPSSADVKEMVNAHFIQSLNEFKPEDLAGAPVWGNPNAKVTIVEFSDFQCPFCKIAAFNIKPYLQEFKDNVKFVFMNYPLDSSCNKYMEHGMHKDSCLAARAAACSQEKGKFWEYHDSVFKNQTKISRDMLVKLAEQVGIEKAWMESCIDSEEALAKVQKDIETGHHVYIMGTPSVFIDQRPLRYWRSPDALRAVVKEEIKRAK